MRVRRGRAAPELRGHRVAGWPRAGLRRHAGNTRRRWAERRVERIVGVGGVPDHPRAGTSLAPPDPHRVPREWVFFRRGTVKSKMTNWLR